MESFIKKRSKLKFNDYLIECYHENSQQNSITNFVKYKFNSLFELIKFYFIIIIIIAFSKHLYLILIFFLLLEI